MKEPYLEVTFRLLTTEAAVALTPSAKAETP